MNEYLKLTEKKSFKHIRIKIRRRKIPYNFKSERKKEIIHKKKVIIYEILFQYLKTSISVLRTAKNDIYGSYYAYKRRYSNKKKQG